MLQTAMLPLGLEAWHLLTGGVLMLVVCVFTLRKRRKSYYGQTLQDTAPKAGDTFDPQTDPDEVNAEPMSRAKRLGAILFLSVWITFWTGAIVVCWGALRELSYGEQGFIFLRIWLVGASVGWIFVAYTLFRLIRGDDIDIQFDGDGDGGD